MLPRPFRALLTAAALAAALAGCGGGGDDEGVKTFEESGFDITFEYPAKLEVDESPEISTAAGAGPVAVRALGLDSDNGIIVERFDLKVTVTGRNFDDLRRALDRLVSRSLAKRPAEGRPMRVGGMRGIEYELPLDTPENGRSRLTFVFDGAVEYELNCQSTPKGRAEISEACAQMLRTLRRR